MVDGSVNRGALCFYHIVIVAINYAPGSFISRLLFYFGILRSLQFCTSFLPLLFQFLDIVQYVAATFAFISLHFVYYSLSGYVYLVNYFFVGFCRINTDKV